MYSNRLSQYSTKRNKKLFRLSVYCGKGFWA